MINFELIRDEVIKSFPETKDLKDPFFHLLHSMRKKRKEDVINIIRVLRTEVYPIIKREIGLGRAAAIYGVRNSSTDMVLYGLVSEILDVDKEDYRDIIVEITLLYSALKFMGKDPDDIFSKVIITLENQEANFLMKYLSRADDLKTPESMGFKITTNQEFTFENNLTGLTQK